MHGFRIVIERSIHDDVPQDIQSPSGTDSSSFDRIEAGEMFFDGFNNLRLLGRRGDWDRKLR